MNNILIITAGLGNGHNSAAKGIKKKIENNNYNNNKSNIEIIDVTEITLMGKIMKFFFFTLSEKILEKIFNDTNRKEPNNRDKFFYSFFFKKISTIISQKNPEKIIFTFPCFPLCLPSSFKGEIIIQITDYMSPHLSWIWGEFNKIYVLDNESKIYLSQYIDEKKIIIEKFPSELSEKSNNIKKEKKNITIQNIQYQKSYSIILFFHNILLGNEENIIKKILLKFPNSSLEILSGRNYDFFTSLYKDHSNIRIVPWQEKIDIFYKKADIVGGKCGGAFISEVMEQNIPIIITGVFSGQEKGNYRYLQHYYSHKIVEI